jgi:polysaccharide deacetylase 2 family uncharacterized protein YibQ
MPAPNRRYLWPAALLAAAGIAFSWWILRPLPQRHAIRHVPVAVSVLTSSPSPLPSVTAPLPTPTVKVARARLAIIIDDAGQWLQTERAFIALPIPLTLAVLPDVRYTRTIARDAMLSGKGVMLHLPMQPISNLNPGPGKITTQMNDAQIVAQVNADLADVPFVQGVNNHEGSKATADPRVMRDVADAVEQHGHLFFVDSLTSPDSIAAATTSAAGIPTLRRNVFLDDVANVRYIEGQLGEAASLARADGEAIAIGHPRPTTLEALEAMIPRIEAEGVRFVLVRDLLQPPS